MCYSVWEVVFHVRLALEWFRLQHEGDPRSLTFDEVQLQVKWQEFTRLYRTKAGTKVLLSSWIRSEIEALDNLRRALGEWPQ